MARYKVGDYFGESCLEPSAATATRKANIVAVGKVTLLKLSATAFKEQLGSLADVTAANIKRKGCTPGRNTRQSRRRCR